MVYALKRVALDRTDAETFQSYTNEIELLKRLRGHDRIIQLIDHQILYGQSNRPKTLMVVSQIPHSLYTPLKDVAGDGVRGDRLCDALGRATR